jgi:hypothetical protein
MFERFDYESVEALVRARTLYYMQIGYNDADLHEPMEVRMRLHPHYVFAFTGQRPSDEEVADFQMQVTLAIEGYEP